MRRFSILVVDDDPQVQRMLRSQLGGAGYEVRLAGSGHEALDTLTEDEPDLVLLDVMMPGADGLAVCRQLRQWSSVPVILLTAADRAETKIAGLDLGADDYLTKPFHMGELLARIRAALRRGMGSNSKAQVIHIGELVVDLAGRAVTRYEEPVPLTKIEFGLLRELVTHPNKVLTYNYLLETVWGSGYHEPHLVQVHMSNLRRKLQPSPIGPRFIFSMSGVGYRFCPID
jgi:two-component system KDP operon response regulator KdpE